MFTMMFSSCFLEMLILNFGSMGIGAPPRSLRYSKLDSFDLLTIWYKKLIKYEKKQKSFKNLWSIHLCTVGKVLQHRRF